MQTSRLFEIVYLLMDRRHMTTTELARELEVSSRTIRRDIDALSAAGVPVYMERGRGGGVHLLESYVLDKSIVSPEEQDDILAALSALNRTGATDDDAAHVRLARAFQREPVDWLDMDFSFWGAPPEYKRAFDVVRQAICSRRLLEFAYHDAAGTSSVRTVEAMKLVFKESCWYVRAFCRRRNDWRTFKLFRIDWTTMRLLDEGFEPRPVPASLNEEGARPTGPVRLKLRFSASLIERAREEFAPDMLEAQDDGSVHAVVDCTPDDRLCGYLLSFGPGLTVIEPDAVARRIHDQASAIAQAYEKRFR